MPTQPVMGKIWPVKIFQETAVDWVSKTAWQTSFNWWVFLFWFKVDCCWFRFNSYIFISIYVTIFKVFFKSIYHSIPNVVFVDLAQILKQLLTHEKEQLGLVVVHVVSSLCKNEDKISTQKIKTLHLYTYYFELKRHIVERIQQFYWNML